MCDEQTSSLSCVSSPSCEWCPSALSCVSVSPKSACTAPCTTECGADVTLSLPPTGWRLPTCLHGGVPAWSNGLGGARCTCLSAWSGARCGLCASAEGCEVGGACVHDPAQTTGMTCECASPLCAENGFGPGSGLLSIALGSAATDGGFDVSLDIFKVVKFPAYVGSDYPAEIHSPFLIRGKLVGCKKSKGDRFPCSKLCQAGGPIGASTTCPDGVPWTDNEQCVVWTCKSTDKSIKPEFLCPPFEPWAENKASCPIVKAVMVEPFELVCTVPEDISVPSKVKCGFATALLPHGQIALTCEVGTCVEPSLAIGNTSSSQSLSWCDINPASCNNVQYGMIFGVPFFLFAGMLGFFFWKTLKQRRLEARISSSKTRNPNRVTENGMEGARALAMMSSTTTSSTTATNDEFELAQKTNSSLLKTATATATIASASTQNSSPKLLVSFRRITYGYALDQTCFESIWGVANRIMITPFQGRVSEHAHQSIDEENASRFSNLRPLRSPTRAESGQGTSHHFRQVIKGVTGYVSNADLMAILGPSGSGKTSFIDILAGRKNQGVVGGEIEINGRATTSSERRKRIGYVMQDDASLPGTSTVREYLMFHACMRLHDKPLMERCERVQDVIEELGLSLAADSRIGDQYRKSLSGGEKRRVSIAVELLNRRELLVLDEPTSGLDSSSTRSVVEALRVVVQFGQGVVMSIHQPSSGIWLMFDRVLILSSHGETMFCGPRNDLMDFVQNRGISVPTNYNPAEFFLDLAIASDVSSTLSDAFNISALFEAEVKQMNDISLAAQQTGAISTNDLGVAAGKPIWVDQVYHISMRNIQKITRHPVLATVYFFATTLVAILAGILYKGVTNDLEGAINRAGLYFFTLTYLMLSALADLGIWQEERIMFMRERSVYDPSAFMFSKFFSEMIPLRLLPLSLYTLILTFLVGLNENPGTVLMLFIILLVVSLVSTLTFLSIGMLIKSSAVANFAAVLWTMYSLLMSGFLLQFGSHAPAAASTGTNSSTGVSSLQYFQYLSVLYYAFESLMNPDGVEITHASVTGDLIVAQLGLDYRNYQRDIIAQAIYLGAFFVITSLLLQFRVREHR